MGPLMAHQQSFTGSSQALQAEKLRPGCDATSWHFGQAFGIALL